MADEDAVGIADVGICMGDATPRGGLAVGCAGDFGKGIAELNGDFVCVRILARSSCRHNKRGAGNEAHWVSDVGICGHKFEPTGAATKMLARKGPESIALLDHDGV